MVTLDADRLVEPLVDLMVFRLRLPRRDADATVRHLIRSEQAGKSSHGLIRVHYAIASGKFGPYGRSSIPAVGRRGPGRLSIDGSGQFGYALLHRLVEAGCLEARRHGLCVATGRRVYPSGSLGDWARRAGRRGVGLVLAAASPRRVAPPGGRSPVVGTNALCIGLPTRPLPFVADSATSEITHGALLLARLSGAPLPKNSAVGTDGRPATSARNVDPTKNLGALLPFGGSHKSFALAMGIELLASLGGGAPGSLEAGEHGVFAVFLGPRVLARRLAPMSRWLAARERSGTRIPGWTSGRRALEAQRRGIVEVPDETFEALSTLVRLDELVRDDRTNAGIKRK